MDLEQLGQENEQWKLVFSVVKENIELRARMQRLNIDTREVSTVCFRSGRQLARLLNTTLDDSQFRKNLEPTSLPHVGRTSSPIHFKSFIPIKAQKDIYEKEKSHRSDMAVDGKVCFPSGRQLARLLKTTLDESQVRKNLELTSLPHESRTLSLTHIRSFIPIKAHKDIYEKAESHRSDVAVDGKDETVGEIALKMLGEIALQLERRIMSFVFQGHRRLYSFTVQNIPAKIREVSKNQMTGKVDEGYRLYLTQRYNDLMKQLNQLGYKKTLHPSFSEFIVNKYGILKKRSGEYGPHPLYYNNPETLKKLIISTAPINLQENLLLLLKCLCNMADKDRRPLILWKI